MTDGATKETYDDVLFGILALEFAGDEPAEAERKIRRKLRRLGLGPYDQGRVDYVRSLRNDLEKEIKLYDKSTYYLAPSAPTASPDDFDYERLVAGFCGKYREISLFDMRTIVTFAIYAYYLR
jgi:hypothetical protein